MDDQWALRPLSSQGGMSLHDDPVFLKDMTRRLSSELSRKIGMPPAPTDTSWMLNPEELPPLIAAYDARIAELERSDEHHRAIAESATAELRRVDETNATLRSELERALESAMRHERLASYGVGRASDGSAEMRELKERLEVLYQENELLTEQQAESNEELDRMRQERIEQAHDQMALVRQIGALRDELAAASARERRAVEGRDRAHAELQKCAAELLQAQENTQEAMSIAERHASERDWALSSVHEQRAQLQQLSSRVEHERDELLQQLTAARAAEREAQARLEKMEASYQDLSTREQAAVDHLAAARADSVAGTQALRALESRCLEAEHRVEQLSSELGAATSRATEAEAEKRELAQRHSRAHEEVGRMEKRLQALQAEEKARRAELTTALKQEAQGRVSALQDEVRSLELVVADLNHQLQRAHRESSRNARRDGSAFFFSGGLGVGLSPALSDANIPISSLISSDAASRTARLEGTRAMDELAVRLDSAERERDTAEKKRRELALQLRVASETHAQERAALSAREEKLSRQVRRLEEESVTWQQERKRLLGVNQDLELRVVQASAELSAIKYQHMEEARMSREERDATVTSLQSQLADARTLHDQSSSELEELLKAQEEMGSRYRTEAKSIAERSEVLVQELRAESERLTIRNAELTTQLSGAIARVHQLSTSEREEAAKALTLQAQLKNMQSERGQIMAQLTQLRSAEKGWLAERKALVKQLQAPRLAMNASSGAPAPIPTTGSSGPQAGPGTSRQHASTSIGRVTTTSRSYGKDVKSIAAQELEDALADARLKAQAQQQATATS
ncbi:hypothetical protein AB1Y20_001461 [Prymnesium parvum]|uniref:Centrosomal protein of 162 kDa n=1 Tax=Prymnesium parvum TaxID=97485 RepID=A0AB34KDS0_PRYPA